MSLYTITLRYLMNAKIRRKEAAIINHMIHFLTRVLLEQEDTYDWTR